MGGLSGLADLFRVPDPLTAVVETKPISAGKRHCTLFADSLSNSCMESELHNENIKVVRNAGLRATSSFSLLYGPAM
jgi:hypothetical protein